MQTDCDRQNYGAFLLRVLLGALFIAHLYWKIAILPGGLTAWWSGLARRCTETASSFPTWTQISEAQHLVSSDRGGSVEVSPSVMGRVKLPIVTEPTGA